MTTTAVRPARNGVDVPTLFATLDAVKAQPELAQFQFRARKLYERIFLGYGDDSVGP